MHAASPLCHWQEFGTSQYVLPAARVADRKCNDLVAEQTDANLMKDVSGEPKKKTSGKPVAVCHLASSVLVVVGLTAFQAVHASAVQQSAP